MGKNKIYTRYKASKYLIPGIAYKSFKLRQAIQKEWAYTIPLSASEEERVADIIEKNLLFDLHEHPTIMPEDPRESVNLCKDGKEFMAYEALCHSGLDAVIDNLMKGTASITSKHG